MSCSGSESGLQSQRVRRVEPKGGQPTATETDLSGFLAERSAFILSDLSQSTRTWLESPPRSLLWPSSDAGGAGERGQLASRPAGI